MSEEQKLIFGGRYTLCYTLAVYSLRHPAAQYSKAVMDAVRDFDYIHSSMPLWYIKLYSLYHFVLLYCIFSTLCLRKGNAGIMKLSGQITNGASQLSWALSLPCPLTCCSQEAWRTPLLCTGATVTPREYFERIVCFFRQLVPALTYLLEEQKALIVYRDNPMPLN